MTDTSIPLARVLAMAFRTIITELHARLERAGFRDVRAAYGFVLLHVRDHRTSVQDVADLMGTTKQAASKLLDAMEASRLVERVPDPDDGRARVVVLTRRGRRMLRCVESIYRDIESEWSEVIGDRELEAVRACLSKLVRDAHGGQLPALRPIW